MNGKYFYIFVNSLLFFTAVYYLAFSVMSDAYEFHWNPKQWGGISIFHWGFITLLSAGGYTIIRGFVDEGNDRKK